MSKKNKKRIVLLDSHAILHRAYHAIPDFQTRSGKPTGALYGLSLTLISIIDLLKPDYLIACYDLPEPTFRHQAYDNYKGGRKKTDDDLIEQLKESYEIFKAFNIPTYFKEGYEADDVIGTLAEILKKNTENEVIIASGDMDILQLVDENVKVYTFKRGVKEGIIFDEKAVEEKMDFGPEYITDYKGLAGDSSDNIPGIKGIGKKTATILINNFGHLENIYQELKNNPVKFESLLTKRLINLLKTGEEEAIFSKALATIKRDVDLDFKFPKKTFFENLDLFKTGEVFQKFEFRVLNDRLKKALNLDTEKKEIKRADIKIDEKKIKELKLAIQILNPKLTNPTLDDILNF